MPASTQSRAVCVLGMLAVLCCDLVCGGVGCSPADSAPDTELDRGFLGLYNLDFAGAQKKFTSTCATKINSTLWNYSSRCAQFPGNTPFPREIARLQPSVTAAH